MTTESEQTIAILSPHVEALTRLYTRLSDAPESVITLNEVQIRAIVGLAGLGLMQILNEVQHG